MRIALLLGLCLTLAACNDEGSGTPDLSAADLSAAPGNDLAGHDLASTDLGGTGATCTTACDCQAGLGCLNGTCTLGTTDVYCCSSATCPAGAGCQGSNGSYAQCAGGGGTDGGGTPTDMAVPPRDAGMSFCDAIACTPATLTTCQAFGCTMCVPRSMGSGMVCGN